MKTTTALTLPQKRPTPPARISCRTVEEARAQQKLQAEFEASMARYRDVDLLMAKFRDVEEQVQRMDEARADFAFDAPGRVVLSQATNQAGERLDAEMVYDENSGASYGYNVTKNPGGQSWSNYTYRRNGDREEFLYRSQGYEANQDTLLILDHARGTLSYSGTIEHTGSFAPPARYCG